MGICFSLKQRDPIVVPAGGTVAIECELDLKKAGRFEIEIDVHLEENGIRTVPVTVRGTALPRRGDAHASPPKP